MPTSITVAEIALRLHETEQPSLRFELEPEMVVTETREQGYEATADSVEFVSLQERNKRVADMAYAELGPQLVETPGLLFQRAHDLWCREIGHDDHASGRLRAANRRR